MSKDEKNQKSSKPQEDPEVKANYEYACPSGYTPEVWNQITPAEVDYILECYVEVCAENEVVVKDLTWLDGIRIAIMLALHDGFLSGVEHIRVVLGSEGRRPPMIVETEEERAAWWGDGDLGPGKNVHHGRLTTAERRRMDQRRRPRKANRLLRKRN